MKYFYNIHKGSRSASSFYKSVKKFILAMALVFTAFQAPVSGQGVQYSQPSWWFGVAGAANFNFYHGSTQTMEPGVIAPLPFTSGYGVGLYAAPLVEFHPADSYWGFMFQAGYDGRNGAFKEIIAPCNCPRDLSTNLSYITIEPSIRFAPAKSAFYIFGGPRVAINVQNSYTYVQKDNPASADQTPIPDEKGNFSNTNKTLVSMQVGAGYDIRLSPASSKTKLVLSPFVSFQPYFGQNPRSVETWNVTTLRAGLALKIGCGKLIPQTKQDAAVVHAAAPKPAEGITAPAAAVQFTVSVPAVIPAERTVREEFPIRNYVYFNIGSTDIPDRYVLLRQDQVKNFKEDHVEIFTPKNLSDRSPRQMTVYYNILNILGDRMGKNPSTTITLVGSSGTTPEDGKAMAESIKHYLVNVFGIRASRIKTEGRDKPKISGEQPGDTHDLEMLKEGDRRVSIESSSPVLLMEFQSGPDAPLKPVEITDVEQAPVESYITFNAGTGNDSFSSWTMVIKDHNGTVQNFGPYTQEKVSIPGKTILGTNAEGDYKVTITGIGKNGKEVKNDTTVHLVLWTPPVNQEVTRFSVIYEFNNAKAIAIYKKYLLNIVIPKIPQGGKVIIHGYADITGDAAHNQKLSLERANDVQAIMKEGLMKAGRKDVTFETYGFGSDPNLVPFKNEFPEERSYNRTVIIDIIPKQ